MRWFLAVLRSFFHSSLSYTFSCHSSPPTILPSSLTSSSHLFLGLVVSRFIYNTLLGILFSSILCTCPNQRNLCSLITYNNTHSKIPNIQKNLAPADKSNETLQITKTNTLLHPHRKTVSRETSKEMAGDLNRSLGLLLESKMVMMLMMMMMMN